MSKLLTAIDIENNNKNISDIVENNLVIYNRKRIANEKKRVRDLKRIALNDEKYDLTKDELLAVTTEIVNSKESSLFKELEFIRVLDEKENYLDFRKNIDSLNDLVYESVDVEKNEIQTISNFRKYRDLVLHSMQYNNLMFLIIRTKSKIVDSYIDNIFNDKIKSENFDINIVDKEKLNNKLVDNCFNIMLKIRKMYNVDIDTDDFDIFDEYGMETNIDYSHKLSDLIFQSLKLGFKNTNILNELSNKKILGRWIVYNQIITNKLFGILFSSKFISNNSVTILENSYTNNVNREYVYRTRTIGELLLEITNEENLHINKIDRQQIYMTYDGSRPSKEEYYKWNGLQVFDIDLKFWIKKGKGDINLLKRLLHEYLSDFHWYLWIVKSASGNGLHIYTKISPPHHIYLEAHKNEYISKYWFQVNYATKLSNIYDILYRLHIITDNNIDFKYFYKEKEGTVTMVPNNVKENMYVDNIVSRVTAGIKLACDMEPLINNNFQDLHVGFGLSQTVDGFEFQETIENILFRECKQTTFIDEKLLFESQEDYEKSKISDDSIDLSKFVTLNIDSTEIKVLSKNNINYITRYNVCNTLASLFGKEGLPIAHKILDSKGCNNVGEINAFYSCAVSNTKEPSKIGLEVLKKAGIIKNIEPELTELVENNYKLELKQQLEKVLINTTANFDYHLSAKQYLSDIKEDLNKRIVGDRVNIVFSPPGSGKTQFILGLAKEGKRILLVLPYISVIRNKVETDDDISDYFDVFYGTKNIKDIEYGRNAVTTFDKFSRINYDKVSSMFDYIMIDESHLLFTSSYRIEATSNVIKKIKELFYISSNDPFAGKIVLMTGTETGEGYFFNVVANIIRVTKPYLNKNMQFLICNDNLDAITRMASKTAEYLNNGYKIMIPTNKGEIYSEKIIGMIEYLLNRPVKYGYYKRSNTEQEICKLINEQNSVGDYEIIFCSNYLSVGVDINDNHKFVSLYLGNFSGYEIEQFNARIRKTGIDSIYCMVTSKTDGSTNDLLLSEPDLLLKINDDDRLFFMDDKEIAKAKTEFIATYDPILHKITTPGFSLINGKIQFSLEEYELIMFETKYSLCMEHPLRVARELSKYGYNINVSTEFDGLAITEQETLKQMGLDSAKEEKIRKHNLMVSTFVDLVKINHYYNEHGLEYVNTIDWILKNTDSIIEDRDAEKSVTVVFDMFASPQQCIVKSREALDKIIKSARYLINRYSESKAIEILHQYVDGNGILKQKNFQRAINLLKLIDNSETNELAEPIVKSLEKMYLFVDKFEINKDYRVGYETYQKTLDMWTNEYVDMLGIKIVSKYGFEKIRDSLNEMLSDVATKSVSKNGVKFSYNRLPEQDSSMVLNKRSIDSMINNMFKITEELNVNKKTIRKKHVILTTQNF